MAVARPLRGSESVRRDPICGWLICGLEKNARVMRLTNGKNYIFELDAVNNPTGRDLTRANALIVFDDENNQFWIMNGMGKSVVRVNGRLLLNPVALQKNDLITVGGTNMMFRPFCCEKFYWSQYTDGGG